MPCGNREVDITFDFIDYALVVTCSDGARTALPLVPKAVADFYDQLMKSLAQLGVDVRIWPTPVEVGDPVPFPQDRRHASYDPVNASRLWGILIQTEHVFQQFRGKFIGKCSPVHFFLGKL